MSMDKLRERAGSEKYLLHPVRAGPDTRVVVLRALKRACHRISGGPRIQRACARPLPSIPEQR